MTKRKKNPFQDLELDMKLVITLRLYRTPYMTSPADVAEAVQRAMIRTRSGYEKGFTNPEAKGDLVDKTGVVVGCWEVFAKMKKGRGP